MNSETKTNLQIPVGFFLGAALSAHQTEGNNTHSDWWFWEQKGRLPKSGIACDHYNRYPEDFRLAKEIGLDALRISIEWARIEPEEGKFDYEEIRHYRSVLLEMKHLGLTRAVTLHHFTLPFWLAQKGGLLSKGFHEQFVRYAAFVTESLGDEIDLLFTINEPAAIFGVAYVAGMWPPFEKNLIKGIRVQNAIIRAHNLAYQKIKTINPNLQVGIVENYGCVIPKHRWNLVEVAISSFVTFLSHRVTRNIIHNSDIIGANYYFTKTVDLIRPKQSIAITTEEEPYTDLHWPIKPEGIFKILIDLKKYNKPVYITENGLADAQDKYRKDYIYKHLEQTIRAIEKGVDVRGYFYWSLVDNFEWAEGFRPRFGLIEMNYETQERKIRTSASIFKEIKTH